MPIKTIIAAVGAFIGLILLLSSAVVIDETERGVHTRLGNIEGTLEPGLHFVNPLVSNVEVMTVSTQKIEVESTAASQDLQDVTTWAAVQYDINDNAVEDIYREYRTSVRTSVIDPAIQDAIKAGTAAFDASELITKRPMVKDTIKKALSERLASAHIRVTNVDIVDFKFSESFNNAIEAKVKAEQDAQKAENDLARVEFEAKQRIEQAKAEAEAIRIQAQAVTQQGGKDYVQLKAIEKWNGILPAQFVPGSAVPFLNLQ